MDGEGYVREGGVGGGAAGRENRAPSRGMGDSKALKSG